MSLQLEQERVAASARQASRERAAVKRAEVNYERLRAPFSLRCGALLIDYIVLAGVMASATLLAQHRTCTDRNTGKTQGDMHPEDHRKKDGVGGSNFDAGHDGRFHACHGARSLMQQVVGFADEDGRWTRGMPRVRGKRAQCA